VSIRIFDTPELLYAAAAASVARLAGDAVMARGRFLLVLSGGETALPLFHRLAQSPYREELPWQNTHVFWADERLVPSDDEASNFGQARSVMLSHLPIPAEQIHAIRGELEPEAAVNNYAKELAALAAPGLAWPRFDLVLLGLGADGHTASLFPGSASRLPEHVPALAVQAQYQDRPAGRVTLTPAAINNAREVIFVVTGAKKAHALARALTPGASSAEAPARLIRPVNGSLTWFVDKDAARLLDDMPPGSAQH
jgi:6-phosphogluconolactonase